MGFLGAYGALARYDLAPSQGGYWHSAWGVFVADQPTLEQHFSEQQSQRSVTIPLTEMRAILLPTPLVRIVQREFPRYQHLIQSRVTFSSTLDLLCGKQSAEKR